MARIKIHNNEEGYWAEILENDGSLTAKIILGKGEEGLQNVSKVKEWAKKNGGFLGGLHN